jgi:chromosome partitioning protein
MAVIAVFNQKGGSGKTMLSVHLAVAAHTTGQKVAVLDLDPQGSSTKWFSDRGDKPGPLVVQVDVTSLARAVEGAAADRYDLVLIDCPPGVTPSTARIIGAADLVVIPVRPEPMDMDAIPDTLKLIGAKNYVFVLSDCPQRAPEIEENRVKLLAHGRPVFGPVNNWRSMWRSLTTGYAVSEYDPGSAAAIEIDAICTAIMGELK